VFWAATVGGIAFTARSLLTEPPPLPIAASVAGLYLALLLSGVLVLRLRMFADALVRGPAGAVGVALTFDDGPDPAYTPEVLDALDRHRAKATFFVIGRKAEANPELVEEMVRRGHEVGVHGFSHARLFSLWGQKRVRADLERAVRVVSGITGEAPRLFRPPIGHTNPTIARVADDLDLTVVGWSVGARDGLASARARAVVTRVARGLGDGAVVLLHDAAERGGRRPAGVAALPEILQAIADKNLRVTLLSKWLPPDP
jgi:peptidoglycan/xylan/chitin deacetylase (PgdA/CDA1 family)